MTTKSNTKARAATATVAYGWVEKAANAMRNWPVKLCGPKPSPAELASAAALIKRHGTGKHLALAMYLRNGGATQPEVIIATGDSQVNAHRDAVTEGLTPRGVDARAGHKAYALALPKARAARKAPVKVAGKGTTRKPTKAPVKAPAAPAGTDQA